MVKEQTLNGIFCCQIVQGKYGPFSDGKGGECAQNRNFQLSRGKKEL